VVYLHLAKQLDPYWETSGQLCPPKEWSEYSSNFTHFYMIGNTLFIDESAMYVGCISKQNNWPIHHRCCQWRQLCEAMTVSIMTLSIMTLSITTLSIIINLNVILNIMKFSIMVVWLCWMTLYWVSLVWISLCLVPWCQTIYLNGITKYGHTFTIQNFGYLMINLAVSEVNTEPILHLIRITNYQAYNFFIYSLSFW